MMRFTNSNVPDCLWNTCRYGVHCRYKHLSMCKTYIVYMQLQLAKLFNDRLVFMLPSCEGECRYTFMNWIGEIVPFIGVAACKMFNYQYVVYFQYTH